MGISDHQLIFCTLKISCLKTGGIHKYLNFCSFKNYTVDFSSAEVLEKLNAGDKRFNEFKKSRLNIDKELYKKANKNCLKIDCNEKTSIFSETINKPKDLWESLKSFGMPNKTVISNFNAIQEGNALTCDTRLISKLFKNLFLNLAESLLTKLPKHPDKSSKAGGIDKLSGGFLKDDADILVKPVSALCSLSISRGVFPIASKVAKIKLIFKNGKKTDP